MADKVVCLFVCEAPRQSDKSESLAEATLFKNIAICLDEPVKFDPPE
jgi:hypothetical protein